VTMACGRQRADRHEWTKEVSAKKEEAAQADHHQRVDMG
jgi:hypothetical protein